MKGSWIGARCVDIWATSSRNMAMEYMPHQLCFSRISGQPGTCVWVKDRVAAVAVEGAVVAGVDTPEAEQATNLEQMIRRTWSRIWTWRCRMLKMRIGSAPLN